MQANLDALPWMDDATKQAARAKLEAMTYQIGYPKTWRPAALTIGAGYAANALAARKAERARLALERVALWKPDLLYASDDDAQEHVTRHYAGTSMPCVFSGVNRDPKVHGLAGAANVTGVLEHEHVVETIRLLQVLQPSIRRLAVITDDFPHWLPVIERVQIGRAHV